MNKPDLSLVRCTPRNTALPFCSACGASTRAWRTAGTRTYAFKDFSLLRIGGMVSTLCPACLKRLKRLKVQSPKKPKAKKPAVVMPTGKNVRVVTYSDYDERNGGRPAREVMEELRSAGIYCKNTGSPYIGNFGIQVFGTKATHRRAERIIYGH